MTVIVRVRVVVVGWSHQGRGELRDQPTTDPRPDAERERPSSAPL
ncbi:hypothetical protein [Streptomyces sp. NPDC046727]